MTFVYFWVKFVLVPKHPTQTPMEIHFINGRFETRGHDYTNDRPQLKQARWRWDPSKQTWYTDDPNRVVPFRTICTPGAQEHMNGATNEVAERMSLAQTSLAMSSATDWDIQIPSPAGLEYLPYQKAGIAYASMRPNTLIGDDMGLGKTIQAIGLANLHSDIQRVLVICPATLRLNWAREWKKWDVHGRTVGVVMGGQLRKATTRQYAADGITLREGFVSTGVVVVNYDILRKHLDDIHSIDWDLLIVDECHYLKNPKAQRTRNVLGKWSKDEEKRIPAIEAKRRVMLTGTAIQNRPIELWPVAHSLDHTVFPKFMRFAHRYCAAHETRFGWDFTGLSNLEELGRLIRESFFIRRLKKDVLKDLPPKVRQVLALPANGLHDLVQQETVLYDMTNTEVARIKAELETLKEGTEEYNAAVARLREAEKVLFTEMSAVRHEVALAKVPKVVDHIVGVLDNVDKVVVFAHHTDVVETIVNNLTAFNPVVITGKTPAHVRQENVDRFQNDPDCRVFVGNIQAAGTGITLTAASTVVFAELDWVPGNLTQAEDRCHRIGTTDTVLVQHIVLDGSLDARMAKIVVDKQVVIDTVLDTPQVRPPKEVMGGGVYVPPKELAPPPNPTTPGTPGSRGTSDVRPPTQQIDLTKVVELVRHAQAHGLKYPKIRFNEGANGFNVPGIVLRWARKGLYVTGQGSFEERALYGIVDWTTGMLRSFRAFTPEIGRFLEALSADPVGFASMSGIDTGSCCFCGLELTDERSVGAGYGPICAGKWGLDLMGVTEDSVNNTQGAA